MKRWLLVVVVGLVAAACGADSTLTSAAGSSDSPATTTSVPTTTSRPAPPTTADRSPDDAERVDPGRDRSILGLGLELDDAGSGRFRFESGVMSELLMSVDGRYWVVDGGVYTALDVDPALIAEQIALLAAAVEATGGHSFDSPYVASLRTHYRGDEFQIGLTDLVRWLMVGGLSAEWAEQWSWFVQADGNPVPPELLACQEAIGALDEASRTWIRDLQIDFVDDTWVFPTQDFEGALATEIEGAAICEEFVEQPGPSPVIVVERSGEPDRRRIDVLVDDRTYTDREPERMFTITMWPDPSVGPSPANPNPAPLLTLRGSYLVAIDTCGGLPWIYSNFAAADTHYAPESGGYPGPVVFASGWLCEDDVPEERRSDT